MSDAASVSLDSLKSLINEAVAALAEVEKFDGFLPSPVPEVVSALDSVLTLAAKIVAEL